MEIKIENTLLGDIVIKDKDCDSGMRWITATFNPPIPTSNNLEIFHKGDTFNLYQDGRTVQVTHKSSNRFPLHQLSSLMD